MKVGFGGGSSDVLSLYDPAADTMRMLWIEGTVKETDPEIAVNWKHLSRSGMSGAGHATIPINLIACKMPVFREDTRDAVRCLQQSPLFPSWYWACGVRGHEPGIWLVLREWSSQKLVLIRAPYRWQEMQIIGKSLAEQGRPIQWQDALGNSYGVSLVKPVGHCGLNIARFVEPCRLSFAEPGNENGVPTLESFLGLSRLADGRFVQLDSVGFTRWVGSLKSQNVGNWNHVPISDTISMYWREKKGQLAGLIYDEKTRIEFEHLGSLSSLSKLRDVLVAGLSRKCDAIQASRMPFQDALDGLHSETMITVADAKTAGNCEPGISRFLRKYGLSEAVPLCDLRKHPEWAEMSQEPGFQRTIILKAIRK